MTPPQPGPPPPYTLELDLRGEMLTYREAERVATIICTFGADPCLVPRTLEGWWYPRERRSVPMTDAERAALLDRIAEHARYGLGLSRLTIED